MSCIHHAISVNFDSIELVSHCMSHGEGFFSTLSSNFIKFLSLSLSCFFRLFSYSNSLMVRDMRNATFIFLDFDSCLRSQLKSICLEFRVIVRRASDNGDTIDFCVLNSTLKLRKCCVKNTKTRGERITHFKLCNVNVLLLAETFDGSQKKFFVTIILLCEDDSQSRSSSRNDSVPRLRHSPIIRLICECSISWFRGRFIHKSFALDFLPMRISLNTDF